MGGWVGGRPGGILWWLGGCFSPGTDRPEPQAAPTAATLTSPPAHDLRPRPVAGFPHKCELGSTPPGRRAPPGQGPPPSPPGLPHTTCATAPLSHPPSHLHQPLALPPGLEPRCPRLAAGLLQVIPPVVPHPVGQAASHSRVPLEVVHVDLPQWGVGVGGLLGAGGYC